MNNAKKTIVIGGVAGGASCAARLRRLDENHEIIMVERGPYISFANCGLPYHISGTIEKRSSLMVTTVDDFQHKFKVDTRVFTEAIAIDRSKKTVKLKNLKTNEVYEESYDYLVLSPGAEPILPPMPGNNLPGVYVLRNIPDLDKVMNKLGSGLISHVTVIGAGFIGVESAENLKERGMKVTLIEKAPQVMPLLDREISAFLQSELTQNGVQVLTNVEIVKIEKNGESLTLTDSTNNKINTDLVLFSVGVKPEIALAKETGLHIGALGGISVDKYLKTSDANIFAVGDAIETFDKNSGATMRLPLAGPANRQGRTVADVIAGKPSEYRGALGSSIVKVFSLTAASVGLTEKAAIRSKIKFQTAWVESKSHASYYPGAESVMLKILFSPEDGKLLGAQSVGKKGIDKRIDVLATALFSGMTVYDLEDLDLAYAPPYSSAKDPVNMIGMVAAGTLRGDHPVTRFEEVPKELADGAVLVDVRELAEFNNGTIPGAISMPLSQLRKNIDQLPKNKKIIIFCLAGYRGYLATRILMQNKFQVTNILGGYNLWKNGYLERM